MALFQFLFGGDDRDQGNKGEEVAEQLTSQFMDRMPGGLFRYRADEEGKLDYLSTGLLELLGCKDQAEFQALTNGTFRGMVYPEDWQATDESIKEQISHGDTDRVRYRVRKADGSIAWWDDAGRLVTDADGNQWFYVTVMDITDQVETTDQVQRAMDRLEILTALSNDVIFDIDCSTGDAQVFGDFQGRFGRDPQQEDFVVNRRCHKECNLDIHSRDLSHLLEQVTENSLVDYELSTPGPEGEPVWYRYQSVVLYDDKGNPVRHVGRLLDTHDMALRESQLRRKAERDSLTGLYNRSAATDRIETLLRSSLAPCTFIAIDVDDFKQVNDTFGHPEGDRVLIDLAEFLTQVMRKEDVVARMGGDEFAVFAVGLAPGPAMDRILKHLARGPFAAQRSQDADRTGDGLHAAPTLSIGAACCVTPPMEFAELYAVADEVLYEAKNAGKSQYRLQIIG